MVPPPARPPLLYQAMGANPDVLRGYAEGPVLGSRGLLHTGRLDPADRELVILRVTARKRAEHEWGVHVAYFGKTSGLTSSQVAATVTDETPDPAWTDRQRAIITIANAVAGQRPVTDAEDEFVRTRLDDVDRVEFLSIASLYLGISALCLVLEIPGEPGAPAFPA